MGPEAKLEKQLVQAVQKIGGLCLKQTSMVGIPDRLIILPGPQFVFVEMKAEHGRLSAVQMQIISRLLDLGCAVHVLSGKQETEDFIRRMKGEA